MTKLLKIAATLLAASCVGAMIAVRRRRLDLTGRVAIVTGGGRGLGLAVTRALVAEGCQVAICGRDGEVIQAAVKSLRQQGAEVWGSACDAADQTQVARFVHDVIERFGKIDILVNNAGQCYVGPAVELSAEDVRTALRNIFWTHYHPTMAVLPHLRQNRFGRIINITSLSGKVPTPHQAAYVAGKYAATGWSQALAIELRREGIEVSTVTPPPLHNGAPLHAHFNGNRDAEFGWFARVLNSRLTSISAERVARVVVGLTRGRGGERAVGVVAWALARVFAALPNVSSRMLSYVERRMPAPIHSWTTSPMLLGSTLVVESGDPDVHRLAQDARRHEARYLPRGETNLNR